RAGEACPSDAAAASSPLLARTAFSRISLSIARVLSVSVSRAGGARIGPVEGLRSGCEVAMGPVDAFAPDAGVASAGSAMRICVPQRLQRTMRRFPRTFSSAICKLALQVSQMNCIPPRLYNRSRRSKQIGYPCDASLPELDPAAFEALDDFLRAPAFRLPRRRGCSVPAFCAR